MRFAEVTLSVPAGRLEDLEVFYGGLLGGVDRAGEAVTAHVGESRLVLLAGPGEPFFHVALLVPGDRFAAASRWIAAETALLPDSNTGEIVFDFPDWDATALYFHDPAGNIMELIAHRGLDENGRDGAFSADELVGVSEVGVVCEPAHVAGELRSRLGLDVWDGTVARAGRLAFVGERGRTLILGAPGRGWIPTGRPSEVHPLDVTLAGTAAGELALPAGGRLRGGA